jgi:gliding motility-associated lipoprotein GldD
MPTYRICTLVGVCIGSLACSPYTPKPRGYFRIEPPAPVYVTLSPGHLPCTFHVSTLTTVEPLPPNAPAGWINLSYPTLEAKIYCSYLPVTPSTLGRVMNESRALVSRQAKDVRKIREQAYEHPAEGVYALLYESDDASASPIQFVLTDSVANVFRGALLYNRVSNADSLAPVTHYLKADVMELIRSFHWKKS